MKLKKEMGWMAFLLIPLIILLTLHFLIPLQFVLNSSPLATQNYNSHLFTLQTVTARSHAAHTQRIALPEIRKIIAPLIRLKRMIEEFVENGQLGAGESGLISNGCDWAALVRSGSRKPTESSGLSMWYGNNCGGLSELSASLQGIYNQYAKMEAYVRLLLADNQQGASELRVYFAETDKTLVFAYPTQYVQALDANLQPRSQIYNQTIALSKSGSIVSFKSSCLVGTCIVFCLPSKIGILQAVTCLYLDSSTFLKTIANQMLPLKQSLTTTSLYLLMGNSIELDNNLDTAEVVDLQQSAPMLVPYSTNSFGLSVLLKKYTNSLKVKSVPMYWAQSSQAVFYAFPLSFDEIGVYPSMHIISKDDIIPSTDENASITSNINSILIPIIVLIVLSSGVSALVLKFLLDSIEGELFQLGKCCNFIVEGDINVQIPVYFGTQDIAQVYEKVRVINKLHRYTTDSYFSGHFASKILKYNEALQFMRKLGYDPGNTLENMGQACTYMEQWDKCLSSLKESVALALNYIEQEFGTLDEMVKLKAAKKVPPGYKQAELVLIRRLFKLNFAFMRHIELKPINAKQQDVKDEEAAKIKAQKMIEESAHYLMLQKKAFFPDFHSYSESIIAQFNECKQQANMKKMEAAKNMLKQTSRILDIYEAEYANNTKKLKEKGSKNKFFYRKNRMTAHSRANPNILRMLQNLFTAKIMQADSQSPLRFQTALDLLFEGIKGSVTTVGINYMAILQIRRLLGVLKIDLTKFESTQLFKQVVPFKTLHYGQITKEMQPQLLKYPTKTTPGLQREFVLMVDCSKDMGGSQQIAYQGERSLNIYDKLIKKTDRVSIIKFNTKEGMKIECNLILKENNETVLRKELENCWVEHGHVVRHGRDELVDCLAKAVWRLANLKSEKVIVVFFKSLAHYRLMQEQVRKKKKSRYTVSKAESRSEHEQQPISLSRFGDDLVEIMKEENLKNCKLILYCGDGDDLEEFRAFFGLEEINKRLWASTNAINSSNNVVYIIEEKHRSDIDRILAMKVQDIADNHVFLL